MTKEMNHLKTLGEFNFIKNELILYIFQLYKYQHINYNNLQATKFVNHIILMYFKTKY